MASQGALAKTQAVRGERDYLCHAWASCCPWVCTGSDPSQEKLADLAGLHRTRVSSVGLGKRNVSLINVARLAIALRVSTAELMKSKERGTSSHQL